MSLFLFPQYTVRLEPSLVARCWRFAEEVVAYYEKVGTPISVYRGIELNVAEQARAKMAECILCLEFGGDPTTEVNWDSSQPSTDWDLKFDDGFSVDVKAMRPGYRYLVWPLSKNDWFEDKDFHALLLVEVDLDRAAGYSVGWVMKVDFAANKLIAGDGHKLDLGTWHMDKEVLEPMSVLHVSHRLLTSRVVA